MGGGQIEGFSFIVSLTAVNHAAGLISSRGIYIRPGNSYLIAIMDSVDLQVLKSSVEWLDHGHRVVLATVVETWGSAPRPPGALLAVRSDGVVSGSVSGGCVEDDLIARVKAGEHNAAPSTIAYGVSNEEAARFGLPCGGKLRLVQEPLREFGWVEQVLARTAKHELVARTLTLATGEVKLAAASREQGMRFDGLELTTLF